MANPDDNGVTYIGKCNFRGNQRVFGIKKRDRRQHMYVIGKTGVGKSVLLKNMALQDIRAGRGIGVVDPHGEFVEEVLSQIPSDRINDVVYFNPVDADFPIGFNILEVSDVKYKHLVVSDLLGIFTKIWANVWSARMEYILQNCILALIDTPGTTLLGIPRILVEKEYRDKIVANVTDPVVRSFWMQEYETWRDQFRNEAIVPIQNKVGQFLNTGFVRNIVGQPTSTLNIADIMNTGKILLVNVSKGRIGEDNAALLGAMIITKIQLAAMERVRIPEDERLDFYLYVDEFQNFSTDSFAAILSEARKYRLNLFIAHQYVGQLVTDVSTKVRDAVFGNVGTMICFRVGATDAEFLEKEFEPEFLPQDLINLPNYHIYLKLMVDGVTSRPFSAATLAPLKYTVESNIRERIIEASRAKYSRPIADVERQIAEWNGMPIPTHAAMARGNAGGGMSGSGSSSGGAGGTSQMFDAQCSNCGKMTQVPFKPDGKRPVYCLSCLKQIEEGKLIPLPERMPSVAKARYGATLGDLGIEFESSKPMEQKPAARPDRPPARSERPETRVMRERERPQEQQEQREQSSEVSPRPSRPDSFGRQQTDTRRPPMNAGRERQTAQHSPRAAEHRDMRVVYERQQERQREQRNPGPSLGVRSQPIVRVSQGSTKVSLQSLKSIEKEMPPPDGMAAKKDVSRQSTPTKSQKEVNPALDRRAFKGVVNASDLRSILNQVLSEKNNKAPDAAQLPKEMPIETPPIASHEDVAHTPPSSGQILKPGDTIKF